MSTATGGFALPADACASYRSLCEGRREFEKDLHQHIHPENNILFPKAIQLEGNRGATAGARMRGQDVEAEIELPIEEADRGTKQVITLRATEICPECHGSGVKGNRRCSACKGAGTVSCPKSRPRDLESPSHMFFAPCCSISAALQIARSLQYY